MKDQMRKRIKDAEERYGIRTVVHKVGRKKYYEVYETGPNEHRSGFDPDHEHPAMCFDSIDEVYAFCTGIVMYSMGRFNTYKEGVRR